MEQRPTPSRYCGPIPFCFMEDIEPYAMPENDQIMKKLVIKDPKSSTEAKKFYGIKSNINKSSITKSSGPSKRNIASIKLAEFKYLCMLCSYKNKDGKSMKIHSMDHFMENKCLCLHCPERLESSGEMELHINQKHYPNFAMIKILCQTCNWSANLCKGWENSNALEMEHIKEKHGQKPGNTRREEKLEMLQTCYRSVNQCKELEISDLLENENFRENHCQEPERAKREEKLEMLAITEGNVESCDSGFQDFESQSGESLESEKPHNEMDESIAVPIQLGELIFIKKSGAAYRTYPIWDDGKLYQGQEVVIGRSQICDIILNRNDVAPEHIKVTMETTCKATLIVLAKEEANGLYRVQVNGGCIRTDEIDPEVNFHPVKTNLKKMRELGVCCNDAFPATHTLQEGDLIKCGGVRFRWKYAIKKELGQI